MASKMSTEDRDRAWKQKCADARAVKWDIEEPGSNSDDDHGYNSNNYDSDARAENRKVRRETNKTVENTKRRPASTKERKQRTKKHQKF